MSKNSDELAVFREFAKMCGLNIDFASIRSCDPPEPDIRCTVDGAPRYFELGRLLDPGVPRLRIKAIREAPAPVCVDWMKIGLPERDMLRKKLAKEYSSGGAPIDLVLFYDFADGLTYSVPPPADLNDEFIKEVVLPEIVDGKDPFERIWIYKTDSHSAPFFDAFFLLTCHKLYG